MRKILSVLVAIALLTPLYPVYAQKPLSVVNPRLKAATTPGNLKTVMVAEPAAGNMANVREKIASRAAMLRKKLAKFKDKTKAGRVEDINTNLNNINSRRTSQMQEVLQKISTLLEKIKAKTAEAGSAGKDVSAINTAIASLEAQWSKADAAIKAQAENDYSITVDTESTVKTDASSARDSLRTDLQMAHNEVVQTRQALANVIKTALSSILGGTNGSE